MDNDEFNEVTLHDDEIQITTTRDTGNGGQHRNTTDSCVVMKHIPTGITVKQAKKSQHQNRKEALKILTKKVNHFYKTGHIKELEEERNEQIGDGGRGYKRRTYKVTDSTVVDHITNKTARLKDILKGKIDLLS